jgi:FkbM family methyltransferase
MKQPTERVIFDIGSNNGDDIPYYLLKAHKVVAVEANPLLCSHIQSRFADEIQAKRLYVENAALTSMSHGLVDFYIHKKHHVLSTLTIQGREEDYAKVQVNTLAIEDLVRNYGIPYYAKIDIEGTDEQILESLATLSLKPIYLSAEAHKIGVFALLSERLNYNSFKLVDGRSVPYSYRRSIVSSLFHAKPYGYSFPPHSAGPFGNDIFGEWMDKASLLKLLALQGLGWKDIHVSAVDPPTLRF